MAKVVKQYAETFIGGPGSGRVRRECWQATTGDGVWRITRQEWPGTPWTITHLPTNRTVPELLGRKVDGEWVWRDVGYKEYGTLKKALAAIESGDAQLWLDKGHAVGAGPARESTGA